MIKHAWVIAAILAAVAPPVAAGAYSDDMAKCLIQQATDEDRLVFLRIGFVATAHHPDVAEFATVKPERMEALSKAYGDAANRLLLRTCRQQTRATLRYEGPAAALMALQIFGMEAGQRLSNHPAVHKVAEGIGRY